MWRAAVSLAALLATASGRTAGTSAAQHRSDLQMSNTLPRRLTPSTSTDAPHPLSQRRQPSSERNRTAALGPAVTMVIIGPGGSPSNPVLGSTVQLAVECDEGCPEWVRVDRTDGVADTSPFVRVVDEQYTFTWAPTFPYFFKPAWGINTFMFGGSAGGAPIGIVASGWTDRYNGTLASPNSSVVTIHYTPSFETSKTSMDVDDVGPGSVRLTLRNTAVPTFDTIRFDRYFPSNTTVNPPQFLLNFFFNENSGTGTLVKTFQEPGVYYYGVTPTFQGRAGGASAGGVYGSCLSPNTTCLPATTPVAIVVKGPNGETGNQTVLPNFAGTVHHALPLRTPHQFCLFERNLTIFSGVQVRLPLCRPQKAEQPPQPGFVSIVVPSWITVQPVTNLTCVSCRIRTSPALNSSETLPGGLTRLTFASLGNNQRPENPAKPNPKYVHGYLPGHWTTYNNFVPLYLTFPEGHDGETVDVSVLIHWTPGEGKTVPVEEWQRVQLLCIATPVLPTLPKRLVTSITWASIGNDLMLDDGSDFWLDTYRHLGFNTVPMTSMPGAFERWTKDNTTLTPTATAPAYLTKEGRAGKAWEGLMFGPQISDPNPSMGPTACRKPPNASLLPNYLSPAQVKVEMAKWQNAYDFTVATGHLDVAYDGIWSQRATLQFCALVNWTQPDWVYLDDESFGEGWGTWKFEATQSKNALARALPHETPTNLAWRMAAEMLSGFTRCVSTVSPQSTVHWYGYGPDCPFPDKMFSDAGISMGPSEYGQPHYLTSYADGLRQVKQQQAPMAGGRPRHLLPWLTACTYGVMDAVQTFEEVLHSFGSGSTGFAFFGVFFHGCFDDPAKLLAFSTATALATPFEDFFLDGTPLIRGSVAATAGELRAWSGVALNGALWLVITPGDASGHTLPSTLSLNITLPAPSPPFALNGKARTFQDGSLTACDLIYGKTTLVTHTAGAVVIEGLALTQTTVLHVATGAGAKCTPLPRGLWLPKPGFNF